MPHATQQRTFIVTAALVFVTTASLTIVWCASMSTMGEMSMPGGWTMSMTWMRMPGQTWLDPAAAFVAMWVLMMVAMMLPSLVPMLWRYRAAVAATATFSPATAQMGNFPPAAAPMDSARPTALPLSGALPATVQPASPPPTAFRLACLTTLVGLAYYLIWTLLGVTVFPLGAMLAAAEMQIPPLARAAPIATGLVVTLAGALQFAPWKTRHLAACRSAPSYVHRLAADGMTAWRYGLRLGLRCSYCCAGLTAILLVVGVMDLRAMAVVTAAVTLERLAPAGERVARAIGVILVGVGLIMIAARL